MGRLTKEQKWVCGTVLSLGIVSAVLGLIAEVTRVKASQLKVQGNQCVYPRSPALIVGILAALILLVAQILVTVVGGCICCCKSAPPVQPNSPASSNRSVAIICLVACWITFLNAFALLISGASLNKRQENRFDGECNVVKPLVFAGGSLLALATVVLDLIFYLASCAAKAASATAQIAPNQIALGQPYPPYYGPRPGNVQTYPYPYGLFPHPPPNQAYGPTYANAPPHPPLGYPDVVTGFPKATHPTHEG